MRKVALLLVVAMLMSIFAVPAMAAEPRIVTIIPELTFNGTTATCSVKIAGNSTSEQLDAKIKLYRGNTLYQTWYAEGDGYIFWQKTRTLPTGYTYKLVVELKVNGVATTPVYVTGSC